MKLDKKKGVCVMGFLSKILSLAPTIGQIIGSFAGSAKAENGDGYVGFFFSGDEQGDVNLAKACFKKEADGTIHALNTATDKNDYVTMCFQGQGPTAPETIRIPGFTDLDVTQVFSRHARAKRCV